VTDSGGDRIGSLSVDIIADVSPLEGAKATVAKVLETFPQEVRVKVDASELTNVTAAAKQVTAALRAVSRAAAEPGAKGAREIKFKVDTTTLRKDITAALAESFKIKLEISNLAEIRHQIE
jgi:hypothetical protein